MTELILLRHGETAWNRELRFQGQVDVPLNEVGCEQARRAGSALAAIDSINAIVSSDLQRARQTAELVAHRLGLRVELDRALREQAFGQADGLSVPELQERHPEAWDRWLQFDATYAFPGTAESAIRFSDRILGALVGIANRYPVQRVLIVTHGGVLDMVYRTATKQPLSGPRQCSIPNAAINRVAFELRAGVISAEILEWANITHLDGMPAQPTYDQLRLLNSSSPNSL